MPKEGEERGGGRQGASVSGFGNHCITFLQGGGRKSGEPGLHGVTVALQW